MAMRAAIIYFLLSFAVPFARAQPPGQTAAGAPSLEQRANAGDAQSQFELGKAYEDGKGVAQDDARAVEWFRKSADQGNAQAQNSLGVMYGLGRGVTRDREEAVRWYRKAAKQGSADGIYNVAISYYNGEGTEANMNDAAAWMMLASRKGDAQATEALKHISQELSNRMDLSKFRLAQLYEKGDEIPQDLPAAAGLYKELAEEKQFVWFVSESRYKLCQMYAAGQGFPQDYAEARSWCKKSGVGFSLIVLGRMAEQGLGQEKNPREAMEYYREAAARAIPDGYMDTARLNLASGSHNGQKNAYFWYSIAVKRNIAGAEDKLREAAADLNEKEIAEQQKRVAAWLKMSRTERMRNSKNY
jgi:uncharacterized protein